MMRKRAQHDVLHIVLAFLVGGEEQGSPPQSNTFLPSYSEKYEPKAHVQETLPRQITIGSLLMMPTHFFALQVPVRLPGQLSGSSSGLPRCPTLLGILFENILHTARFVAIYSFVLCFIQGPKRRGLLAFSGFLTLARLVQCYIPVVHGLPFCSHRSLG